MAQDKAAEIINLAASRGGAANDGETAGSFLASARAAAGLSIEEVSGATKVKVAHLQAIEEMRADLLPALPYTIGFVKAYARHLGLDADAVAARFKEDAAASAPATLVPPQMARTDITAGGEGARIVSVFAILAIVLFGIWVVFQLTGGEAGDAAAPEPRVRLGDAPAVQPTPRPSRQIPPDSENETPGSVFNNAPAAGDAPISDAAGSEEEAAVSGEDLTDASAAAENQNAAEETGAEEQTEAASAGPAVTQEESEPAPVRPLPRRRAPPPSQPRPEPVIVEAELIRSAAPVYPERCARSARAVEQVTLNFDVTANGRAANTRVVSSTNDCFEAEAVRTIARWRFSPKTINGTPAADAGKTATLNFRK